MAHYAHMNSCPPFDPECETVKEFFQRFRCQMSEVIHKCRNDEIKKASLLLKVLPVSIISEIQRRIAPDLLTAATFDVLEQHLMQQFSTSKSTIGASVEFLTCRQSNMSLEEFARKLNSLAAECKYPPVCLDRLLRDTFVAGLSSSEILKSLIQVCDPLSFRETVERAKLLQTFSQDVKVIHADRSHIHAVDNEFTEDVNKLTYNKKNVPKNTYTCYRCGAKGEHFSNDCFAKSLTCKLCNKTGHIARICQKSQRKATSRPTSDARAHFSSPSKVHTATKTSRCDNVHDTPPTCCCNTNHSSVRTVASDSNCVHGVQDYPHVATDRQHTSAQQLLSRDWPAQRSCQSRPCHTSVAAEQDSRDVCDVSSPSITNELNANFSDSFLG